MTIAHEQVTEPGDITAEVAQLLGEEEALAPEPDTGETHEAGESPASQEAEASGEAANESEGTPGGEPEESAGEGEEEQQEPEAASADETPIETLTDLAKELEADPADLYALKIPIPNDEPVEIGKLKDIYQQYKTGELKTADELKQFEQQKQQLYQQLEQEKQQALQYVQQLAQMPTELQQAQARMLQLQETYQKTDWEQLEQVDPGDAALQRQKLADAYAQAQAEYQQMAQALQMQQQQYTQAMQQQVAQAIFERHPEWKEPEKAREAEQMMQSFLSEFGFQPGELAGIMDPRVYDVVYEAAKLKQQAQEAEKALKQPQETQRKPEVGTLRKGALKKAASSKKGRLNDLLKRAKSSPYIEDKAAAVTALLSEG